MSQFKWSHNSLCSLALLSFVVLLALSFQLAAAEASRKAFATPEDAVKSLVDAVKANDEQELISILGPSLKEWIESGDPIADREAREKFVADYEQNKEIDTSEAGKAILVIGEDEFPFPIPLVKTNDQWTFDPEQGKQEIIDRRVGTNELDTIETLLAIVDAQNDYAELNPLGKGAPEYARRFISSPGKHDGLYWPSNRSEAQSPLGTLVAEAATAGYQPTTEGGESSKNPYHGYYFRMLTAQGSHAPGGAYSYLVNGRMIGGFAVIAWPAKYGASGYKTFMINQDQTVYETDLGTNTAAEVKKIRTFDPDKSWKRIDTN
ncbi:hypothetical protein HYPDE_39293 [Hyphomicrobium denitrificans 1NES1]|uniref:DUF2950 domain-containing protein n=1 Tax=Hyphomicrobium denitrificans 1NES1 TaxID=670307 RepID=N0B922_9HYPH|nr:DUF2950 domain-containing protein [Hyphomicrobium denitrificans]AGK59528.1 hypothetical protein HYPDE_39293 [Hyphomicrobium denitrificans 1NES1]